MRKVLAFFVVTLTAPFAGAGEVELAAYGGYTFPFYSQTFPYNSGPVEIPIPGVGIEQGGEFVLDSSGGLALAGALTLYATEGFGLEVRLEGSRHRVRARRGYYATAE